MPPSVWPNDISNYKANKETIFFQFEYGVEYKASPDYYATLKRPAKATDWLVLPFHTSYANVYASCHSISADAHSIAVATQSSHRHAIVCVVPDLLASE